MRPKRGRKRLGFQRWGRGPSGHLNRRTRVALAAVILFLIGLIGRTILRQVIEVERPSATVERPPASGIAPQLHERYTDAELNAAVNQLFRSVNPALPENQYFPQFAKDKIWWIITQKQAGKLSIILLENVANAHLVAEDLMASGTAEGKPMIVISQPSFLAFLLEGGRMSAPFTQQQRNDFAIGLVHEVVHLQNPKPGNPARLEERLQEELRTWREVDVNVVRQLRQLNEPMNRRLIQADDLLRSCGDNAHCEPLTKILLPGEKSR